MHTDIIKALMLKQHDILERVSGGDYSEVCYKAGKDKEFGTYDINYVNRLRLAYCILFEGLEEEELIRKLFEEELKDRESNDFQGIGTSLEILAYLLAKFNEHNQYEDLFKRAGNANFDCACGFDKDIEVEPDINQYDIWECIEIALETEYKDEARELVSLWKKGVTDWNDLNYRNLIMFNKKLGHEAENEEPLKVLLVSSIHKGKNQDIISAYRDLIHYYIELKQYEQAYCSWYELVKQAELSEIYSINLFKYILEDCMELVSNYHEKSSEIWAWARPFIKKKSDNMYGNLYKKSIEAAAAAGDEYAEELKVKYELWKKRVQISTD